MEENFNWQLASNSQLKEECERLEKEFKEKQDEMREMVKKFDEISETMTKLSKEYVKIKEILDKREGKKGMS